MHDLIILLLLIATPEKLVQKVTNKVETPSKNGTNSEESSSLSRTQNLEDRIDPEPSDVIDVVDPDQVSKEEHGSDEETLGSEGKIFGSDIYFLVTYLEGKLCLTNKICPKSKGNTVVCIQ